MSGDGLFDSADWQGQWIGSDALNMNQLRRTFTLPSEAARATVFYSGVGYSELWMDGEKVDPSRVLDPGWTQYYRRCLYVSFGLTQRLTAGPHAVGVVLGDGTPANHSFCRMGIRRCCHPMSRTVRLASFFN